MAAGLLAGCKPESALVAPAGPVPVTVAVPIARQVQDYEEFTGRVAAKESVDIHSRVTGYLDRIGFKDGAEVKQGDLLFVVDRRPFQAIYDNAMAHIALSKANLAFREAELARNKDLVKTAAVSGSEYDQSAAAAGEARASVTAAEASAESAKLNLGFTEIRAPIQGIISNTNITRGNLVVADQTILTNIVSDDPMYVKFDADERRILRIQQDVREGRIKESPGAEIPVEMGLDIERGYPHQGVIDFADNQIDQATGTIQVRGVFPNPLPAKGRRVLIPGMFGRVRVPLGEPRKAVLIAEQALGSDQGQKYVFVVDKKKEVQYRRVKTGRSDAGLRVIEDGLQPGEEVMVGGLQRVRPGMSVEAKLVDMASFSTAEPEKPGAPAKPAAAAKAPEKK
jgi:RND family efflux transporter MFP subunit